MSVAVLCPGPSLPSEYCEDFDHSLVVAVNSAAWHYPCDWMCGGDNQVMIPTLYEKRYPLPRVGFVTNKQWGGKVLSLGLKQEPPPLGNPRNCLPAVQNEAGENSCGYTFPSAYAFARARGTPVVYGMDYAIGSLDFVGLRGDHSENRFRQELLWLRSVWIPGTVVHGRVSLKILDYLNSK